MNINNLSTVKKQSGVILVVALVILLVLTLLVVSSMNTTNTQVLMTGNTQFHTQALNDAESALRYAESEIELSIASGTPIAAGFYNLKDPTVVKPDITNLATWSTQAATYTAGNRSSLYVIEYVDFTVFAGESVSSSKSIDGSKVHLYRITSRSNTGRGAARILQSVYITTAQPVI
jgi:type IV pilus assembly protein PilX